MPFQKINCQVTLELNVVKLIYTFLLKLINDITFKPLTTFIWTTSNEILEGLNYKISINVVPRKNHKDTSDLLIFIFPKYDNLELPT